MFELELNWNSIGTQLELDWNSIRTRLELDWNSIGHSLLKKLSKMKVNT